jgi:hypothetical protein
MRTQDLFHHYCLIIRAQMRERTYFAFWSPCLAHCAPLLNKIQMQGIIEFRQHKRFQNLMRFFSRCAHMHQAQAFCYAINMRVNGNADDAEQKYTRSRRFAQKHLYVTETSLLSIQGNEQRALPIILTARLVISKRNNLSN